jgi:hypothetical protein
MFCRMWWCVGNEARIDWIAHQAAYREWPE